MFQPWMEEERDSIRTSPIKHHFKTTCVVCSMAKTLYGVFYNSILILSVSTLLMTLFSIALDKCSDCLYSTFHLLFSFPTVTFGFSHTCHLINKLKHIPNQSMYKALQSFLLSVYLTRNKADVATLYIITLRSTCAKSVFNTLLSDFTQL